MIRINSVRLSQAETENYPNQNEDNKTKINVASRTTSAMGMGVITSKK